MKPRGWQASATMVLIVCLGCAWAWPLPATEVTVDAAVKHQTIEGFGTCLISPL